MIVFCTSGVSRVVPRSSIQVWFGLGEMIHEMRHAAFAAGKMKREMRSHQRPAQAGAVGDRRIHIGDRHHAFRHQMNGLAPERDLQAVGDVGAHFLLDVDRMLAERAVEFHRLRDRLG